MVNNFRTSNFLKSRFDWIMNRILTKLKSQIDTTLQVTADMLKLNRQKLDARKRMGKNRYFLIMTGMSEYPHATSSTKSVESWLVRKAFSIATIQHQSHRTQPTTTLVMPKAIVRSRIWSCSFVFISKTIIPL